MLEETVTGKIVVSIEENEVTLSTDFDEERTVFFIEMIKTMFMNGILGGNNE